MLIEVTNFIYQVKFDSLNFHELNYKYSSCYPESATQDTLITISYAKIPSLLPFIRMSFGIKNHFLEIHFA